LIRFAHSQTKSNPGDWNCSPGDYFDFGPDAETCEIIDLSKGDWTEQDILVLGGGGVLNDMFLTHLERLVACPATVIFWGVGTNRHFWPDKLTLAMFRSIRRGKQFLIEFIRRNCTGSIYSFRERGILLRAQLVGLRDYQREFPIVPCSSCMHPVFDAQNSTPSEYKLGIWGHKQFLDLQNAEGTSFEYIGRTIEEVVNDMKRCETVLTSSYHCAYWAKLLGKPVRIASFSTKHLHFNRLSVRAAQEGMTFLEWCRKRNLAFCDSFRALLR
jgi:hypothetical protein